jgi:hypothetical protein
MQNGKNNAKLKKVQPSFSPSLGENDGKIISTWNFGTHNLQNDTTNCILKVFMKMISRREMIKRTAMGLGALVFGYEQQLLLYYKHHIKESSVC